MIIVWSAYKLAGLSFYMSLCSTLICVLYAYFVFLDLNFMCLSSLEKVARQYRLTGCLQK